MMKKTILISASLLATAAAAQSGNVGINTSKPTAKLHVLGGVRFEPTSTTDVAAVDKILVSDANGNAAWKSVSTSSRNYHPVWGTTSYTQENYFDYNYSQNATPTSDRWKARLSPVSYTGTSLTLPPGKWLVFINVKAKIEYTANRGGTPTWGNLPADKAVWVRCSFSENKNTSPKNVNLSDSGLSPDIIGPNLVSNSVVGPSSNSLVSGELFINNTSTGPKIYYLKVATGVYGLDETSTGKDAIRLVDFGLKPTTGIFLSNKIIAYPIL